MLNLVCGTSGKINAFMGGQGVNSNVRIVKGLIAITSVESRDWEGPLLFLSYFFSCFLSF